MARPYQRVIAANAYKNNGATVVKGGAADTTGTTVNGPNATNVPYSAVVTRPAASPWGSKVQNPETDATIAAGTDTAATYKPLSAGNFATQSTTSWLMRGAGAMSTLAGVANTILNCPAAYRGRKHSIHRNESRRTIQISSWDYATGAATISSVTEDSFGEDHAARPTQDIPGEMVYLVSGNVPTQHDYAARKLWQ
jgi:hypothetical protein